MQANIKLIEIKGIVSWLLLLHKVMLVFLSTEAGIPKKISLYLWFGLDLLYDQNGYHKEITNLVAFNAYIYWFTYFMSLAECAL